ncbi:MAG: Rieske 2Fe-2S domain-containing protein [Polyangiaceae bacterium]|nr:Rieske 2Fe-2S domain-containing protein [Polyangiaceae bacterium]
MADGRTDEGAPTAATGTGSNIDPRVDEWSRRGLTGTARSGMYEPTRDPDDVSRAPNPEDDENPPRWRADFPIDWPKDELVARRDFAKFLVLTSGAFVVGQGWIAAQHLVRKNRILPATRKIGSLSDIPIGGVKEFAFPTEHDPCLLVRLSREEVVAFSQSCTHLSCAVVPKVDEGVFLCPCHEGYFDIRTGKNIAGPPPRPLPRIVLRLEGDDVLAVGIEERMV